VSSQSSCLVNEDVIAYDEVAGPTGRVQCDTTVVAACSREDGAGCRYSSKLLTYAPLCCTDE